MHPISLTLKEAPAFTQVYEGLLQALHRNPDLGCSGTLANWVFQPPNPFDSNQRHKPKPELLILFAYVALMAATFAFFNLW
jgi:hypothetical protein